MPEDAEAHFCPNCGTRLHPPRISPLAAVLVLVLSFFASVAAFPILYVVDFSIAVLIVSMVGELMFLLVPLIYMLHKKVDVRQYIMIGNLRHLIIGLGLGIALQGLSIVLGFILTSLLGPSLAIEESNQVIVDMTKVSPAGTMLFLLIPGICEEFAFRAFLQNALKNRYSRLVAILGSSLAFGVVHFDQQGIYMIVTFVIGLFLGYFYDRFRSYAGAATAHTTFNMATFAILMLAS